MSDYMRQVADQIAQWVPGDFASLGADGFGFSDTRPAARRFFAIDGPSIAVRALAAARQAGRGRRSTCWPRRSRKYRLHDVTAGTTGSSGGDA